MKFARLGGALALAALVALALVANNHPARGSDDRATVATISRPGADIADTYLFPSPSNPNNVVAVMTVNPGIPAGAGSTTFFDPTVLYQMKFDTNYGSEASGTSPTENIVIQFSFNAASAGAQQVNVYGPAAPNVTGSGNTLITQTTSGLVGRSFSVNGVTFFAGPRQDSFFFDEAQFYSIFPDRNAGSTVQTCLPAGTGTCPQGFNNPGTDAYAGTNVLAIVAEIPKTSLAPTGASTPGRIAYWATTSSVTGHMRIRMTTRTIRGLGALALAGLLAACSNDKSLNPQLTNPTFHQIDRVGRPGVNVIFAPWAHHDANARSSPSSRFHAHQSGHRDVHDGDGRQERRDLGLRSDPARTERARRRPLFERDDGDVPRRRDRRQITPAGTDRRRQPSSAAADWPTM